MFLAFETYSKFKLQNLHTLFNFITITCKYVYSVSAMNHNGDISSVLDHIMLCYLMFYEIEPSKSYDDKDQDDTDAH